MDVRTPVKPPPIWLLVLITFSGTLAMHMFVPALPDVARDLKISTAAAQGTLSLYVFGLAIGQLFYGPLADRFGRRPILLVGLSLYTAAGISATLSSDIAALLASRFAQALGGCVGLILGRAIVRDTTPPDASLRRLALVNLAVTTGPAFAPIIGGAIAAAFGWRWIFVALTLLGILNVILALTRLPETGSKKPQSVRMLARDYKDLLTSKAFAGLAIGGSCSTTSIYGFIAAAPFIFSTDFHRPSHEIGLYLALMLIGMAGGSIIAGWLSGRVSMERIMVGGNAICVLGASALLATALTGYASVASTVMLSMVFAVGVCIASPAALTKTISLNPRLIGSAAGLYGFTQMAVGAICTSAASIGSDPMVSSALVLTIASVLGQVGMFVAARQQPKTI